VAVKLFSSRASPFVRKVRIVAAVKGLAGQIEHVYPDANAGDPALNAKNPLGKLPCLIGDDGLAVHDSHVICEYLDQMGSGPVLLPREGNERWRTLTLASLADGIMDAALLAVYERRYRPEDKIVQSWLDRQWGKIHRGLAQQEAAPPVWHAHPDYGHITLACALGYLDFRHSGSWRDGHPALVGWLDRFGRAVPAFDATTPDG
jgi:glutathione S-transferase